MMQKREEKLNTALNNLERLNQEAIKKHFLISACADDGLMEMFLILGADPDANNKQAMQKFVNEGNLERIKLLRKYGADINVNLDAPIKANNLAVVKYMLEEGAEVKYCLAETKQESIEMTELILKHNRCVTDSDMEVAIFISVDMIKLLLPYVKNRFPERTFHEGMYYWGKIHLLPTDVLEYILYVQQNEPDKLEEIMEQEDLEQFIYQVSYALKLSITEADYSRIKLIINYLENKEWFIGCESSMVSDLGENAKCSGKLNEILYFLKEKGVLQKVLPKKKFSGFHFENFLEPLYRNSSIETLEILGIELNKECFKPAILYGNKELVGALIERGIKPSEEDEKEAFRQMRCLDGDRYEIFKMIVIARKS